MRAIAAPSSRSRIRVRNRKLDSGVREKPGESRAFSLCSASFLVFRRVGEDFLHLAKAFLPSFRRRPESILILSFDLGALTRKPSHVPVWFRPPSWRPSHFLCLPKESNPRKGTLEVAVRGHPCPRTPRAGSGVRRQYVHVRSTNSRASCARPFGLFLRLLAATWRGPGEEQSAAVPAAEAKAHKPRRPREGGDPAPLLSLFALGSLCEAAEVGWGLAAGLLPCRQRRAVLARPACGARGLFQPTSAASQRGPESRAEQRQKALGPRLRGDDEVYALRLLRQGLPRFAFPRVPSRSRRAGGHAA